MTAAFSLVGCLIALAQPEGWHVPLLPQLAEGQELVYNGKFVDAAKEPGTQGVSSQGVESRIFVLKATAKGTDVAILTLVRPQSHSQEREETSVNFELVQIGPQEGLGFE